MEEADDVRRIENKDFHIDELNAFIGWFDYDVKQDIEQALADKANDFASVLRYLRHYEPNLYHSIYAVSRIHYNSSCQVEAILNMYLTIRKVDDACLELQEKVRNGTTKRKKRARERAEPEKITKEEIARASDPLNTTAWYVMKTPYVQDCGKAYINTADNTALTPERESFLRTLYLCDGAWAQEQLSDVLDKLAVPNLRLKDLNAVEDTVRWAVATNEEFVADQPRKRGRAGVRK